MTTNEGRAGITPVSVLPDAAVRAAQMGNLIEAIKITRREFGLGLAEAKAAGEASVAGGSAAGSPKSSASGGLPMETLDALDAGSLIEAIKVTQAHTGMGLREAKLAVEAYLKNDAFARGRFEAAGRGERSAARWLFVGLLAGVAILAGWWLFGRG